MILMETNYKARLKKWALDRLGQRIASANEAMQQAQASANSEEKSSAGDKYETGRAMGHLQKDMHARQLAELLRELAALHAINADVRCVEGCSGALLRTDPIDFFIAIGLGRQIIEGRSVVFLSPQAPLAQELQNKKPGDVFLFQKESLLIREIL
jgi:hypothetical protein